MKTKDVMMIVSAALGTATLTVVAFWAGPLDAGGEAEAAAAIAKGRLVSRGVELTLGAVGGRAFKAGDQPEFELTAVNTTDQPASASVGVTMSAAAAPNPMARMIQMPSVMWRQEQVVKLEPGETKVLALSAKTNLPPDRVISVSLQDLEQKATPVRAGIVALSFSTAAPKGEPLVALGQ